MKFRIRIKRLNRFIRECPNQVIVDYLRQHTHTMRKKKAKAAFLRYVNHPRLTKGKQKRLAQRRNTELAMAS